MHDNTELFDTLGILESEREKLVKAATAENKPMLSYLVEKGIIDSYTAQTRIANKYKMYGWQIRDIDIDNLEDLKNANKALYENKDCIRLIKQYHALPYEKKGGVVYIAVSDPTNNEILDRFGSICGFTDFCIVDEIKLTKAITTLFGSASEVFDNVDYGDEDVSVDLDTDPSGAGDDAEDSLADDTDNNAPVVRIINGFLNSAVKQGASDLHFEPYEKKYRVRFRIDGILHEQKLHKSSGEAQEIPISYAPKLAARIKVISHLDIAERRVPQDGRIKFTLASGKTIDMRVNTLPTLWGEKIVMRILDSSAAKLDIDKLGYEPEQKEKYLGALNKPQGLILVTGPTGSGKTVSLYTGLRILNQVERNVSTAEDPVEINLEGINQVQINNKAGLNFASALRAFLRQDPDVIMVGEIRDLETAEIAIKAAQTGHLVLSTLHTNSAPETLTRLLNMGVPAFNIASSVTLIMAQRLARRLCDKCKILDDTPEHELVNLGYTEQIDPGAPIYKANTAGCPACSGGYKGRVGVYEIFKMSDSLSQLIMEGGNSLQIAALAEQEGMVPLRKSGWKKVAQGVTSISEVLRVTSG